MEILGDGKPPVTVDASSRYLVFATEKGVRYLLRAR
jgi:hypothetical protein